MMHKKQNLLLFYFGLWIMKFYMWFFECSLYLSCCVVFKIWKRGSRDGWSEVMRNGAVQNVFGIRLGLLAGVVGGAYDHRWREKARLLFENIEESAEITIRGGSWHRRFKSYFFWRVPSCRRLVKSCDLQAYNEISKDYRVLNFRVKQCQNFDFAYICWK